MSMLVFSKALEILAPLFQSCITWEPRSLVELPVIGVVNAFNDVMTPRFNDRDKDRGNLVTEAQPDFWAKGDQDLLEICSIPWCFGMSPT